MQTDTGALTRAGTNTFTNVGTYSGSRAGFIDAGRGPADGKVSGLGFEAEAGAVAERIDRAEAAASYDKGGFTLSADANAQNRLAAQVKAGSRGAIDTDGLHHEVFAGAEARVEHDAHAGASASAWDGKIVTDISADAHAEAVVAARAGARADLRLDGDSGPSLDLGFGAGASASATAEARAHKSTTIVGFGIEAEAYASARVGIGAEAHGFLTYKDGKLSFGLGFGVVFGYGTSVGFGIGIKLPKWAAAIVTVGAKVVKGAIELVKGGWEGVKKTVSDAWTGVKDFFGGLFGGKKPKPAGPAKPTAPPSYPVALPANPSAGSPKAYRGADEWFIDLFKQKPDAEGRFMKDVARRDTQDKGGSTWTKAS